MERIDKEQLIFGIHPIREALKGKRRQILQIYIIENKAQSKAIEEVLHKKYGKAPYG